MSKITFMKQPHPLEVTRGVFCDLFDRWFFSKFKEFSEAQKYSIYNIHSRQNTLISSPTGSGKTLGAFGAILNELINLSLQGKLEDRIYCVYVSPLRALSLDIHKNLVEPLKEIEQIAGKELGIRVAVRTGDTTAYEKSKMLVKSPHILITTPETLSIVLSSVKFRNLLYGVQWLIVDEVHALAENKRGVHLSLSLERLQEISPQITRTGLSATAEPLDRIAQFLVGEGRDCLIANVQFLKKYDLQVVSPVPDLINVTYARLHMALYKLLDALIQEHKTTLIFTNTRSGTERVIHHLKQLFPSRYSNNIAAHHGSLGKKHRIDVEMKLKKGELKAVSCSTSLELGIDIGYIDLVICLGSPKSVARLLQRCGRAGHALHETVKGRIIVLDRDDLVECSVLLKDAIEKKIDKIHIPENCLDVLAQHMYGMAIERVWNKEEMFKVIKKSYCYRNLTTKDFEELLSYLSGEFVSLEDRNVYAKIWYDKETGNIGKRGKLARVIYMTNIGTIPDATAVVIKVGDAVIGTIDEGFLEKLKRGDIFVLGGNTYEFQFARGMVAQVKAAAGKSPTVPSWYSEMLPLSFDLAMDIQRFRRYMLDLFVNKKTKVEILDFIQHHLYVDENAIEAIYEYFKEQYLYAEIPHDRKMLIEYFTDEHGKKFALFHSLFGRRVNDVLSRAVAFALSKLQQRDVEIGINDNGFYVASEKNMQVMRAFDLLDYKQLKDIMVKAIDKSEVLKRRFRHCAGRAMMILRSYKGKRKMVGRQQVSSMILMVAVKRISQDFCILREARREVLEDLMDIDHAIDIMKQIKEEKIEVKQIHTQIPTPFAFNLVTQGFTDILKIEDKIDFLRRMHEHVLAKIYMKHAAEPQ